jgi:hypothetical protein
VTAVEDVTKILALAEKMDCTVQWQVVNAKGYLAPIETLVKN